jgi:MerR family mercuric resistance operon transcriptional regulator
MTQISPKTPTLTIGKLAKAAGVGVETIRYYQKRSLLPIPESSGAYRHYPWRLANRIRFIKRAQELGFSLDEVSELLSLEEGIDRGSIRRIANERLAQIQIKMADLKRMNMALSHLVHECEQTGKEQPCPIISTLIGNKH